MHYVSADSLWFCSNFSSVLIVMQVVAMGLCFVDDAICCVFVNNQNEACLECQRRSDAGHSRPLTTPTTTSKKWMFLLKVGKGIWLPVQSGAKWIELRFYTVIFLGCFGSICLFFIFTPNSTANTKCSWPLITQTWKYHSTFYPLLGSLRTFTLTEVDTAQLTLVFPSLFLRV